jgi:phenylacetate-CoA ligase
MTIVSWLPRFRRAARDMKVLEEREAWSRAEIEAFQVERLNHLWAHATGHVPYYANLARERRLPERFGSVDEFTGAVPILPKILVRQRASELISVRAGRGEWHYTSGSTGIPMAAYWSFDAHRESLCVKYRSYAAWGVNVFDRTVFLWGHGASEERGLRGWWSHVRQPYTDRLRSRLRISACNLAKPALREYLRKIQAFRPAMLYGYSRALYLLAIEAEAAGFKCDSLRLVVATSEPAWPHMIDRMQRAFGAQVIREYGAVECGIIATDVPPHPILRVREDHVLLETLPRDDSRYDIVATVLNNPSFPLIRYAIGDVTDDEIARPQKGFASLSGVAGRNNDLLRTHSGDYLHWLHIEYAVSETVQAVVRRFAVYQRSDGSVQTDVELDDPLRAADVARDLEALRNYLQDRLEGYPVTVRAVDCVAQTAAGKHVVVRSELYDVNTASSPAAASMSTTRGRHSPS